MCAVADADNQHRTRRYGYGHSGLLLSCLPAAASQADASHVVHFHITACGRVSVVVRECEDTAVQSQCDGHCPLEALALLL